MSTIDPNKYGLSLHTTSSQLGLSLSNFTGNTRHQIWDVNRELSTYLHQYLIEFIKPQNWTDLAFIAVAKGPGSFTSTRIGIVTARTLAQQLDLPLFAISTLAALVWSEKNKFDLNQKIAIQMEATRGQLYVGIYQISMASSDLIVYLPDTVMPPEAWQKFLDDLDNNYQLLNAPTHLGITTTSLLELAYQDWQQGKRPSWLEALPFYGNKI